MFAKLYDRGTNQCLVKLGANDEDNTPEVRFYFEPQGLGVCSAALVWNEDDEQSWDEAQKAFDATNAESAWDFVEKSLAAIGQRLPDLEPRFGEEPHKLKVEGFDECIIGVVTGCGREDLLCYSMDKIIDQLVRDGMDYDEAIEHYGFNIKGYYMGPMTPMFLEEYIEEDED